MAQFNRGQAGTLYRKVMSVTDKANLAADHLPWVPPRRLVLSVMAARAVAGCSLVPDTEWKDRTANTQLVPGNAPDLVPAVAGKPRLRGWIHAGGLPFVLAASIVLVALARPGWARATTIIYALCALTLFATSAAYHRGNWAPRTQVRLRRLDHCNIYLLIAGTSVPVDALGLTGPARSISLWVITVGATIGIISRLAWPGAPRAIYTATYIVLGWSTLPVVVLLFGDAGTVTAALVVAGGALYTAGAITYGLKRPNPSPAWFGFHEIFHLCTLAAWACQYIAIFRLAT